MSTNSIFPIAAIGIATIDNDGNFLDASYTDIYHEVLKEHAFFSFLNENMQIHSARITTLGEKVEDTFLISPIKEGELLDEHRVKKLTASLQNL